MTRPKISTAEMLMPLPVTRCAQRYAIRDAKTAGANFVVLPECSNFGWADSSAVGRASELVADSFIATLADLAQALQIYVAVGFVEQSGDKIFNSAVLLSSEGKIILHHRKINELDFAKEIYSVGSSVNVVETEFGKVGLMICADALSETDQVTERLLSLGADLILSPSAWAVPPTHDNQAEPYGSLWVEAYRRGLGSSRTWIIATSNVGIVESGVWAGHPCIGNSIAMGPGSNDLIMLPFGQDAVHTEIIAIQS